MNKICNATAHPKPQWSIAIFAARETADELLLTLEKAVAASTCPSIIDIVVNGNPALREALLANSDTLLTRLSNLTSLRLWFVAYGNKAHAWNQYVSDIWPNTSVAFFVDGYVQLQADNLQRLAESIEQSATALAASGFPISGQISSEIQAKNLEQGGLHGNLFAIKHDAMQALRERNIRLPIGLYGFDTVLGGFLGFGLDPAKNAWDMKGRITTEAGVHWHVRKKRWWKIKDLKTQSKRVMNNALRVLVRKSTTYYLREQKRLPESLPKDIEAYIMEWANNNRGELCKVLMTSPLSIVPYLKLRRTKDRSFAEQSPELSLSFHCRPDP